MSPEILAVPRKRAHFEHSKGKFVPKNGVTPEVLKTPHVRVEGGEILGYESGFRSGLLVVDGEWYKAKGCRPSSEDFHGGPFGTQTYSFAQNGADRILERRETFLKEGFEYPIEPLGFWVYTHIRFNREPTAATIYRVAGDTRLDEFLWWIEKAPLNHVLPQDRDHIKRLLGSLGFASGRLIKALHKNHFTWDQDEEDTTNAHTGNVVIFPGQNGKMRVGLVDFDNSLNYTPGDPNDGLPKMEEVHTRDRRTFKDGLGSHSSVSGSTSYTWNPYDLPRKLADNTIKKALPGLSDDNSREVQSYLLDKLRHREFVSYRGHLIQAYERGYKDESSEGDEISWDEIVKIRGLVGQLGRKFRQRASQVLTGDRETIVMEARRIGFISGYRFPVVVDKETVDITPPETTEVGPEDSAETLVQLYPLLAGHELALRDLPFDGENFFKFPPLSRSLAEQYAALKPADIKNIAHLWIHEDLKSHFAKIASPRAIGALLLSLSQTHAYMLAEMVKQQLPGRDEPISADVLIRANELLELIPKRAVGRKDMREYLLEREMIRLEGFNLEREVGVKSGISLLAYGFIPEDLHYVFNHARYPIILNEFGEEQIPALKEAVKCPKLVDPLMGDSTQGLLLIALTGAEVRARRPDLTILEDEARQTNCTFLHYFYATQDKFTIQSPKIAEALAKPASKSSLVFLADELIVEGMKVHPDSTFAQLMRDVQLEASDIVTLMKTALDITGGDLSQVDPVLLSSIERAKYVGEVDSKQASDLILACVGFGIDLPEFATRAITGENMHQFLDILTTHGVHRSSSKYGLVPRYPNHPVHAIMSKGLDVLPDTIKKLYDISQNQPGIPDLITPGILNHLFGRDYYQNYFGAMINHDGYPEPEMTIKDIFVTPKNWEIWRIVHPDIWELIGTANPDILRNYIKENIPDGTIKIEFTEKERGMVGTRNCKVAEALPPYLYKLVASPINDFRK